MTSVEIILSACLVATFAEVWVLLIGRKRLQRNIESLESVRVELHTPLGRIYANFRTRGQAFAYLQEMRDRGFAGASPQEDVTG